MRSHLKSCLEAGEMTPFPAKRRRVGFGAKIVCTKEEKVYCVCRLPNYDKTIAMIACTVQRMAPWVLHWKKALTTELIVRSGFVLNVSEIEHEQYLCIIIIKHTYLTEMLCSLLRFILYYVYLAFCMWNYFPVLLVKMRNSISTTLTGRLEPKNGTISQYF